VDYVMHPCSFSNGGILTLTLTLLDINSPPRCNCWIEGCPPVRSRSHRSADDVGGRHSTPQRRPPRRAAALPTRGTGDTGPHLAGVAAEVSCSSAGSPHPSLTHAEPRQRDDARDKGFKTSGREDCPTNDLRHAQLFTRLASTVSDSRRYVASPHRTLPSNGVSSFLRIRQHQFSDTQDAGTLAQH